LFDQLKTYYPDLAAEYKYRYTIKCQPLGNKIYNCHLIKYCPETRDLFQFINGDWCPYKSSNYQEKQNSICTDPLFLFYFVREINQFIKYRIFLENSELIPRLQTTLTTDQRTQLFELLVEGEFIPKENKDCFIWALNAIDDKQTQPPVQWKKIQWKKSKMAFVELFTPFCETITSRLTNRFIGQLFLDELGEDLKSLKKPKKDDVSSCYGDICSIIDKLKI
jgi:hypothetical protein